MTQLASANELGQSFYNHVKVLQESIIAEMKHHDPSLERRTDEWDRLDVAGNPGGGGITCVLEGELFENAGVNVSCIQGQVKESFFAHLYNAAKKQGVSLPCSLEDMPNNLWASGISLIIHPRNPRIPTIHANFRFLMMGNQEDPAKSTYWFGGGTDLTPYYPHVDDFCYFHETWKNVLENYPGRYQHYKKWCDDYFTNTHRNNEMRGVGGIFFDYMNNQNLKKDYGLVTNLSEFFNKSYFPLVEKRKKEEWGQEDEDFMLHRHGRYVEFNLLHDRGTLFGLKTNGRTDSILVSLPKRCCFSYMYEPKKNSPQMEMLKYYRPMDWS